MARTVWKIERASLNFPLCKLAKPNRMRSSGSQLLLRSEAARSALLAQLRLPAPTHLDVTDGLRLSFTGGRVVHLRPSGNAPEFRIYTEADTSAAAQALLQSAMSALGAALAGAGGKAA
jgi:phosphomannomutase